MPAPEEAIVNQAEQLIELKRLLAKAVKLGEDLNALTVNGCPFEVVDLARWIKCDMDTFIKEIWGNRD
jgi:hypothetical protein